VSDATRESRLGEHAVYPGTFNPITPGHLDIIDRARQHFARITVLVAVNAGKQPATTPSERAAQVRRGNSRRTGTTSRSPRGPG
jgi:pantetheine-phosphate adenylyltransferase